MLGGGGESVGHSGKGDEDPAAEAVLVGGDQGSHGGHGGGAQRGRRAEPAKEHPGAQARVTTGT